jgi:uncharacterized Ntn-hydrolase superfamily protein
MSTGDDAMRLRKFATVAVALFICFTMISAAGSDEPPVGTYSIVARDPVTGDLGVAVQSKFLAVGSVVPWAKAGTGAIATQAQANTSYGPEGLRMLAYGWTAQEVLDSLLAMDPDRESRQVGIVDQMGNAMAYTGSRCQAYAGHKIGQGYAVQGNILAGAGVLDAMASAYEKTEGDLPERLLAALAAGEKAGGDSRGRQSAALLVVREGGGYGGYNDRFVDLRVDDSPDPLGELTRIYGVWNTSFGIRYRLESIDRFNSNKQFAAAQEEMRRIVASLNDQLRDHPDDPEVLSSVAWTLATYDLAKDRALELAKRAATLAPGQSGILDVMAECHYRLGHVQEAIAIESELVAKEPANDHYWKQLQKFKGGTGR